MTNYTEQVREYLTYCRRSAAELAAKGSALDPRYHPTEAGACRMIPHSSDTAEARKIREAFRVALAEQDRERRVA